MNALGKKGNKRHCCPYHYLSTILLDMGWGKPVQHNENVNLGMSYLDYVKMIEEAEEQEAEEQEARSIEVRYTVDDL